MENSARKLLAIIGVLILFIIAGLFTTNTTVFADTEVSYLAYNTTTKKFETQSTTTYTSVTSTTDFSTSGTYVVDDDVVIDTIDCGSSDLTLILCDGKTLTLGRLYCHDLTIYAQGAGTGKIVAKEDITTGSFITCVNDFIMHGGEITTGEHSVNTIILCQKNVTIYNAKINGTANTGIYCYYDLTIENAVMNLIISQYGIYADDDTFVINNGTYNITGTTSGVGTAFMTESSKIEIDRGVFNFNDIGCGFYAKKDIRIEHGRFNITAANYVFYSDTEKIFIKGTGFVQSANTTVAEAARTITVSYSDLECICLTHRDNRGVFHSTNSSYGMENIEYRYKDSADGEWYQASGKGPGTWGLQYLKVVPLYNHITVWVEDMSVKEGTDISSIEIPYGFGYYENRGESYLETYKEDFELAATKFRVTVNCDGTTPGTYDYVLSFVPEYEGQVDDHYIIVFGDTIGHFVVTAAPPASTPEPESPATPEQSSEQANNTPTPNADVPQNDALDEPELSDEDIAAIEKFWEEYGCIGLVVVIIDAFMLFDFIFVILYLLQNKKHPDRKSIMASKILRFIGLALAILALIFAIVAIIIHQCTFSTIGIVWSVINIVLFVGSYLVKFKKDEIYG